MTANKKCRQTTILRNKHPLHLPFSHIPTSTRPYLTLVASLTPSAEVKHGRICMLAWLGFVAVDNGARIYPLPEAYKGLTSVTAHDALVENGAMGQILLFVGLAEMVSWIAISQMLQGSGRKVRRDILTGKWSSRGGHALTFTAFPF